MGSDIANDGEFVSGTLPQCVRLEPEQSEESKQEHHASDPHNRERDFLPDRPVAQVPYERTHFRMLSKESYFRAERKKFCQMGSFSGALKRGSTRQERLLLVERILL
jgi:hypothetical protein